MMILILGARAFVVTACWWRKVCFKTGTGIKKVNINAIVWGFVAPSDKVCP